VNSGRNLLGAALFMLVVVQAFAQLPPPGAPGAPDDPRYCGEPARDASGRIKRSRAELRAFVAVFPCPTTLEHSTSCPGAAIDHTWSLAKGGCDTIANMTWLPDKIKSCAGKFCKDRWERKYYGVPFGRIDLSEDATPREDEVFVGE